MADKVRLVWSVDGTLLSVQVWTDRFPGRPFPAWVVLCDINSGGEVIWNSQEAKQFRAKVIAQLCEEG